MRKPNNKPMKKPVVILTTILSLTIILLPICCSCSSQADSKDGYIPIPGLSFGMSVEEAMEAVPSLEYIAKIPTSAPGDEFPEGFFDDIPRAVFAPNATVLRLANTTILGKEAIVYLRFMRYYYKGTDSREIYYDDYYDDEDIYYQDFGLDRVHIEIEDFVDMATVLEQFNGVYTSGYDNDDPHSDYYIHYSYTLYSVSRIGNLDEETLQILRNYYANFPLIRESDAQQSYNDYSFVIDGILGMDFPVVHTSNESQYSHDYSRVFDRYIATDSDSLVTLQYNYRGYGYPGELILFGHHAAILYKALQSANVN